MHVHVLKIANTPSLGNEYFIFSTFNSDNSYHTQKLHTMVLTYVHFALKR